MPTLDLDQMIAKLQQIRETHGNLSMFDVVYGHDGGMGVLETIEFKIDVDARTNKETPCVGLIFDWK